MPDEQFGLGPAGVENPEEGAFASKAESLVTASPEAAVESDPIIEGVGTEKKYEKLLSQVSGAAGASGDEAQVDIEHLHSLEGETERVAHLVKLAQTKGLPHAVTVAGRLKDYYALDKLHDELIDNLYEELLKNGLITRE